MKVALVTILSLLTTSYALSSEVFKTNDKEEFKEKILELKNHNIPYIAKKITKGKKNYLLLIQDYKRYKNARIRRNKKVIYKGKLYFLQFENSSKKKILRAREIFNKRGFLPKHIKLLIRNLKSSTYEITYTKPKSESLFSSIETSFAQSKLRLEAHTLNNDYESQFLDFLTGLEFNSKKYSGKAMLRLYSLSEINKTDDYREAQLDIDETYINRSFSNSQITIGKQLFSWGVFDEFSNLDRVNLKNLKRFIFDTGEDFRRPITALRYEHYLDNWKLDTFYNFGLENGKMLHDESIWFGVDKENGFIRGGDRSIVDPNLVKSVNIKTNNDIDSGYGVRLSHSGSGDFSLTYLKAYADLPILRFSDSLRSEILSNSVSQSGLHDGVELVFVNEDVFGFDYVNTIGKQLYKIEVSYIPNSLVVSDDLKLVEVKKGRVAVGGDIEVDMLSTTIIWQFLHQEVLSDEEMFLDNTLTQSIFQTSSRFFTDKLESGLRFILNHNDNSNYVSPYVNFEINDSHTLGGTYNYFSGNEESYFGYHKDESFFAVNYSYIF